MFWTRTKYCFWIRFYISSLLSTYFAVICLGRFLPQFLERFFWAFSKFFASFFVVKLWIIVSNCYSIEYLKGIGSIYYSFSLLPVSLRAFPIFWREIWSLVSTFSSVRGMASSLQGKNAHCLAKPASAFCNYLVFLTAS